MVTIKKLTILIGKTPFPNFVNEYYGGPCVVLVPSGDIYNWYVNILLILIIRT